MTKTGTGYFRQVVAAEYDMEEDFPEKVSDHLRWLSESGFRNPHLVWQKWNYAVIAAEK